ncbi:hypothetical protein h2es_0292 [Rickettsiales endosymbiont of Trichoplax sp. H2]|nr:hypothetical protein [Rickettsiales endosymbiont of Trichoplax sp. H2]
MLLPEFLNASSMKNIRSNNCNHIRNEIFQKN